MANCERPTDLLVDIQFSENLRGIQKVLVIEDPIKNDQPPFHLHIIQQNLANEYLLLSVESQERQVHQNG